MKNIKLIFKEKNRWYCKIQGIIYAGGIILFLLISTRLQLSANEKQFPPEGSNIPEQIDIQTAIKEQIRLLDSPVWKERQNAHKQLLELIKNNKHAYHFFLIETGTSKNPEIRLSSKEILRAYFEKNVYDPSKGNGFIGIQLAPAVPLKINKERYFPIRVVMPIVGFPGEKAGIRAGDAILEIDNIKCSSKFRINEFVAYIATKSPGETVTLKIFSGGRVITKKVILAKRPESATRSIRTKTVKELFREWYKLQKKEFEN